MVASVSAKIASASVQLASLSAGLSALAARLPFYILNALFFGYFLFLWVFLVIWVGWDAAHRGLTSQKQRAFRLLVLVFNFPGLLLYLLLRPPLTLKEQERIEMEQELLELELEKLRREVKET